MNGGALLPVESMAKGGPLRVQKLTDVSFPGYNAPHYPDPGKHRRAAVLSDQDQGLDRLDAEIGHKCQFCYGAIWKWYRSRNGITHPVNGSVEVSRSFLARGG